MPVLDLNARRAARAEARGEPHLVLLGDDEFTFPHVMPVECLELMGAGKFRAAFELLLGPEQAGRFMAHRPTDEDLEDIAGTYYGGSPGESSASPWSSANGGTSSKLTSLPATGSTSPKRATGRHTSGRAGSSS